MGGKSMIRRGVDMCCANARANPLLRVFEENWSRRRVRMMNEGVVCNVGNRAPSAVLPSLNTAPAHVHDGSENKESNNTSLATGTVATKNLRCSVLLFCILLSVHSSACADSEQPLNLYHVHGRQTHRTMQSKTKQSKKGDCPPGMGLQGWGLCGLN